MLDTGQQIRGTAIAYNLKLRTVTAPGGKAVRLSGSEMAIFNALARMHPKPVRLSAIERERRHVFMFRLRAKLKSIDCGVVYSDNGYVLSLATS